MTKLLLRFAGITKDNENMIDKVAMKKMKKGVVIINTSRGKLINSKDLIKALSTEKIGGVGLDVFDDEGDFFLNDMSNSYYRSTELSVLLSMPNVVITSHQAFFLLKLFHFLVGILPYLN